MKIEIKKGWIESGVVWIAIVGRAGIGKSHNIDTIVAPLKEINKREIRNFAKQIEAYNEYMELSKKEKENVIEVPKPTRTQFIVGDITIEALFDFHDQNPNGIGILRDELSGWIKDLNKYRAGSDLETYLSCWSNQEIVLTRKKTSKSSYVPKAYVPIIGGVQPSILSMHYTPENKENGFIDRWLLCYPDLDVDEFNENEMDSDILDWYHEYVVGLFDKVKNNWVTQDEYGNQINHICRFDQQAKKEWVKVFNQITALQNSETENEYMKSILPKQKSYVARFCLLLTVLNSYEYGTPPNIITKEDCTKCKQIKRLLYQNGKKEQIGEHRR